MNLFPLGLLSAATSEGTINSVSFSLFEPNAGCRSYDQMTNLSSLFENQVLYTRQKALPYLIIEYSYDNIYDREFQQIDNFLYSISSGKLNPFFLIDFSRGQKPNSISNSSGDWTCTLNNTRFYSTTTNYKSNYGLLWDGYNFKIGDVISLTSNVSITIDTATLNYGSLSLTKAQSSAILYPVYEVYSGVDNLSEFKNGDFFDDKYKSPEDSGYLRSGSLTFISKYKI